ncbi:MAG TPA: Ig-like domain-containing protein, partial [Bacillota bacterium]|nr:Ig-like domain-containing protein [Bacillota bacterium]
MVYQQGFEQRLDRKLIKLRLCIIMFIAFLIVTLTPGITRADTMPMRGNLDCPRAAEEYKGTFNVYGWFLDETNINKVEVYLDGRLLSTAQLGDVREDVYKAYPLYNNHNAGFHYSLNTYRMENGPHNLSVKAYANCGETKTFANNFIVANTTEPRGTLDEPAVNQTISGQFNGRGWFLDGADPSPVIDILVDNAYFCTATYGDVRNDVYDAYIPYHNKNAGFHFILDTTKLTNGPHTIAIRETPAVGPVTTLGQKTITVFNVITN